MNHTEMTDTEFCEIMELILKKDKFLEELKKGEILRQAEEKILSGEWDRACVNEYIGERDVFVQDIDKILQSKIHPSLVIGKMVGFFIRPSEGNLVVSAVLTKYIQDIDILSRHALLVLNYTLGLLEGDVPGLSSPKWDTYWVEGYSPTGLRIVGTDQAGEEAYICGPSLLKFLDEIYGLDLLPSVSERIDLVRVLRESHA